MQRTVPRLNTLLGADAFATWFLEGTSVEKFIAPYCEPNPTRRLSTNNGRFLESLGHGAPLEEADRLAKIARDLEPNSKSIAHTQAEIARKRANAETVPLLKEQFRRQARQRLGDAGAANSEFVLSSKTKLLVDEVFDLISGSEEADIELLADKVLEAETEVRRAEQLYSDSPDFFETEARLCTILEKESRALSALQKAWSVRPRGSGIAIRLSRAYATRGDRKRAKEILDEALSRNLEDRGVHYEMARFLLSEGNGCRPRIGSTLGNSYIRRSKPRSPAPSRAVFIRNWPR